MFTPPDHTTSQQCSPSTLHFVLKARIQDQGVAREPIRQGTAEEIGHALNDILRKRCKAEEFSRTTNDK